MNLSMNQKEQWAEVNKNECDVLKQIATFQPDAPLKVTLILEESDTGYEMRNYEMPVGYYANTKDKNNKITSETVFGSQILPSGKFLNSTEVPPYLNSQNFTMDNNGIVQNTNKLSSNINYKTLEMKKILPLLDSLSKNIIRIINHWYDTYNNYKNDQLMFEKAKNNYLQFKKSIFEVSYVTVESTILPQANNFVFIEKFITRTLEIASNISGQRNIPRSRLHNIISDLINWTKQKKRFLETSKTFVTLDHNSLTTTNMSMNIAPKRSLELNNINGMYYYNNYTSKNMHKGNDHFLNNIQGIINSVPLKRNSILNIPDEKNVKLKRQKVAYNNCYFQNNTQASTQNYRTQNDLLEDVLINNNNNSTSMFHYQH